MAKRAWLEGGGVAMCQSGRGLPEELLGHNRLRPPRLLPPCKKRAQLAPMQMRWAWQREAN